MALENARLFEETKRRAGEMAALTEIGREVSASLDLSTVLERIGTRAREVLAGRYQRGLPAAAGRRHAHAHHRGGRGGRGHPGQPVAAGRGLIGQITATRQPEIIIDTVKDPRSIHIAGTGDTRRASS